MFSVIEIMLDGKQNVLAIQQPSGSYLSKQFYSKRVADISIATTRLTLLDSNKNNSVPLDLLDK